MWNSRRIVGIATLSTVLSSTTMNADTTTIASVNHRRGPRAFRSGRAPRRRRSGPRSLRLRLRVLVLQLAQLREVERLAGRSARIGRAEAVEDQGDCSGGGGRAGGRPRARWRATPEKSRRRRPNRCRRIAPTSCACVTSSSIASRSVTHRLRRLRQVDLGRHVLGQRACRAWNSERVKNVWKAAPGSGCSSACRVVEERLVHRLQHRFDQRLLGGEVATHGADADAGARGRPLRPAPEPHLREHAFGRG